MPIDTALYGEHKHKREKVKIYPLEIYSLDFLNYPTILMKNIFILLERKRKFKILI